MPRDWRRKSYKGRRVVPYAKRRKTAYAPVRFSAGFSRGSGLSGIPLTIRTKLRYVETLGFSSATGAISSNIFRLNSLYDPNETGVGHQPMYFDQLAALYEHYVVLASVISVTFCPSTDADATAVWNIGIVGNANATISASADTNKEMGHSVSALINGRDGGPNQKTLKLYFNLNKNLNLTKHDSDAGAATNANPNETYKGVVWCNDIQATGTTNLVATIVIEYDVEFSQRTYIAGS